MIPRADCTPERLLVLECAGGGEMGGLNGRQMVDAIRRSRPQLKVLFIIMHALVKPFTIDVLRNRIHGVLSPQR